MAESRTRVDVLVVGGGVAGLWTLARLRASGYRAALVESRALGAGQSIASQGIIHGGIKYSLAGAASRASAAIAAMPEIWRKCLAGEGEVDLRRARVLSERQYLWTTTGIGSRLVGLAASKIIRTGVERQDGDSRPEPLRAAPSGVSVYAVAEPVLDPSSLLHSLAAACGNGLLEGRLVEAHRMGAAWLLHIEGGQGRSLVVETGAMVLAAGEGNAPLARLLGLGSQSPAASMQRRPLHMVMARGDLPEVFGHCVGMSDKPRITITTQTAGANGQRVWYIGGLIAEEGVGRDEAAQIEAAKREAAACIGWVDLSRTMWSTLRIDRAEGLSEDGARPDEPVVRSDDGVIAVWPTKLAFAPLCAEKVEGALRESGVAPTASSTIDEGVVPEEWARPSVAPLPWEREGVRWN